MDALSVEYICSSKCLLTCYHQTDRPTAVECCCTLHSCFAYVTDDDTTVLIASELLPPSEESDCDASLSALRADGGSSPSAQRRKRLCKLRDSLKCRDGVDVDRSNADADNIYTDSLPEVVTPFIACRRQDVMMLLVLTCFLLESIETDT